VDQLEFSFPEVDGYVLMDGYFRRRNPTGRPFCGLPPAYDEPTLTPILRSR
jgi:CO dehydrogenase/acetyl-CoA synthase beta subunit